MKVQSRNFKVHVSGTSNYGENIGTVHIIGQEPDSHPYVWIGDGQDKYLASIDARQMDALCREWQKRRKKK